MNSAIPVEDEAPPEAVALIESVDRLTGRSCHGCTTALGAVHVVYSIVLGFKNAPHCLACLARGLHREPGELETQLVERIQKRDCFRQALNHAREREGVREAFPTGAATENVASPGGGSVTPDAAWDAGDMSCGDLVLALRLKLNALPPGSVLQITARDPAAPADLPSWCRLTGHRLLRAEHPDYFIQRKEN